MYPSHPTPAPYHGQPLVKHFNFAYTAIFNILGNPVTQLPLGIGQWGVPLGVQVGNFPYLYFYLCPNFALPCPPADSWREETGPPVPGCGWAGGETDGWLDTSWGSVVTSWGS